MPLPSPLAAAPSPPPVAAICGGPAPAWATIETWLPRPRPVEAWPQAENRPDGRTGEDFDAIYLRWVEQVRRWTQIFGAAPADRDDLVQEIFLIVHRHLRFFDGKNVRGWLYQITKRRVRDHHLSVWIARVRRVGDMSAVSDLTTRDGPDHDLQQRDEQRLLDTLLASLSEEQRAAFVMFEMDARSGAEIASIQGASVATVWMRIHRARQRLRRLAARHRSRGELTGWSRPHAVRS